MQLPLHHSLGRSEMNIAEVSYGRVSMPAEIVFRREIVATRRISASIIRQIAEKVIYSRHRNVTDFNWIGQEI
jgi:hypothetical protein